MLRLIFTMLLTLASLLYAQSSSSQTEGSKGTQMNTLLSDSLLSNDIGMVMANNPVCKSENAVRLNLLILDDYFVVSQLENGKIYPDTLVTKIFSPDTARQHPVWTRVYGVKKASPESVLSYLKEIFKQSNGKIDREEIFISYPLQGKSILTYKKFVNAVKKIGYTKIRIVGKSKEFSDDVYKKLQLKKYSEKQIKSWESTKSNCNRNWLRIVDNKLCIREQLKQISHHDPKTISNTPPFNEGDTKARSAKDVMDVVKREKKKLNAIYNKFEKDFLKSIKTPEHPDAKKIEITIKFTIAPEGNISKMEIISSNSQNEEFDQRVSDEVSKWIFEKAEHPTTLTVPFKFDKD